MFLLGTIGSIFILTALGLFAIQLYYLTNAKRLPGKIIAIERYQSDTGHAHEKIEQTYYRALYEYHYNGEKVWFVGAGSNKIDQQIGSQVEILGLKRGPEFCAPKTYTSSIFAAFFGFVGTIAIGISWREFSNWELRLTPIFFTLTLSIIIMLTLKRKGLLHVVVDGLIKQSQLETIESLKGREIYWSSAEINIIKKKHAESAIIVSSLFLLVSSGLTFFLWSRLPAEVMGQTLQQQLEAPEFVGFLVTLAFTLISLASCIHSLLRR